MNFRVLAGKMRIACRHDANTLPAVRRRWSQLWVPGKNGVRQLDEHYSEHIPEGCEVRNHERKIRYIGMSAALCGCVRSVGSLVLLNRHQVAEESTIVSRAAWCAKVVRCFLRKVVT